MTDTQTGTDDVPAVALSFGDRAVYLREDDALVIADVHLGRGAASVVDAPIDAVDGVVERLSGLLERFEPETVVVAGDLLHSFSFVPQDVRKQVDAIVRAVETADANLVLTPGNHDPMVEDVFSGAIFDSYRPGDGRTVVYHGDVEPTALEEETLEGATLEEETDSPPVPRLYVVGHDHPALSIDGRKRPCFLYGSGVYPLESGARVDVLVLPAFSRLARGTTVNRRRASDFQSPLITAIDPFYPVVRDVDAGETLWFPRLGECRELL